MDSFLSRIHSSRISKHVFAFERQLKRIGDPSHVVAPGRVPDEVHPAIAAEGGNELRTSPSEKDAGLSSVGNRAEKPVVPQAESRTNRLPPVFACLALISCFLQARDREPISLCPIQ